jgi:hypothetical protein
MPIGIIVVIVLVIFLLGGLSGRFLPLKQPSNRGFVNWVSLIAVIKAATGFGYGHRSVGIIGAVLIIAVALVLLGQI